MTTTTTLRCPSCDDPIEGATRQPGTGLLDVAPCGCQVSPDALGRVHAEPVDAGLVIHDEASEDAWYLCDQYVELEEWR